MKDKVRIGIIGAGQIGSAHMDAYKAIPEAVDVCVHNNKHAPLAVAAMKAGKHVYCEKPIAGSYRDGADMVRAAAETRRRLHIQLNTVFSASTRAAQRLVDEERRAFSRYSVEEMGVGWVRLEGGIALDIEESWAVHHDGQESSKILLSAKENREVTAAEVKERSRSLALDPAMPEKPAR